MSALPAPTPETAPFQPLAYGEWENSPEAARIADPLERIQKYDDRTRRDLFRAGLYDSEAETEISAAGADQAFRAGLIASPEEYAPAAKDRDSSFYARQLINKGDTDKAQDIYRYNAFLADPSTDPETLERARRDAEIDPDTKNELVRSAVRSGQLPFAVVPDKDGNAVFEIDPELGALDRTQILDLAGDDIDARFLPDLERQLTRVPGTNYTPAQFRQSAVFDGFLKEQIKTDEFLFGQLQNAQDEYNRSGQLSTETQESLDRTLAALDADNEFAPATRSRLIRDTIKRASKPEGYDPENPQQHVQYLEDGTVWLPEQVIFDQAKHDQVLDSLSVTPEQKEAAKKLRAGRLESIAPAMVDAMGANPDALDFFEKSKAAGKSDAEIATEWYSKPDNYSWLANRARSFGMSLIEAGPGLFQSIAALSGSESAREALQARAQDTARNEEYARLFGDSYGVGQSLLNTSSQVAVDLLAGLAVSAVATPVAGAAVAGSRAAASSLVRGLARTAISEGARSTAAGFLRSGAGSAARTLATMGDDVAAGLARSIGGQTGVAASSFTRSAGSAYVQAYSALDAQTNAQGQPLYSDEEKRKIALGTAMTAGTATAAITLGFGRMLGQGAEGLITGGLSTGVLRRVVGMTDDQIISGVRQSALAVLRAAAVEAPEEATDQLVGNVIQALGTGEEFRLGPALKEALEAGLVGGLLGGGIGAVQVGINKYRSPKVVALENANAPASAAALEAATKAQAEAPADPAANLKEASQDLDLRVTELKAQVQELSGDPKKNAGKLARAKKRLAEATAEKTRIDYAIKNPGAMQMGVAPEGIAAAEARGVATPAAGAPQAAAPQTVAEGAPAQPVVPTPAAPVVLNRRASALSKVLTNKGVSDGPATRFAAAFARNLSPDTTLEDARGQILEAFRSAGGIFADETADTAAVRANPQTWVDAGYTPEESQKFAELAAAEIEAAQEAADAANEAIVIPEPAAAEASTPEPAQTDATPAAAATPGVTITEPTQSFTDSPFFGGEISTPDGTKGHYSVKVLDDGTAVLSDIQIGYEGDAGRGKGFGTQAYEAIGRKLAERGITLQSTRWDKHQTAVSPQALRVWEKLEAAGLARKTGESETKVYDRQAGRETIAVAPEYEFVVPEAAAPAIPEDIIGTDQAPEPPTIEVADEEQDVQTSTVPVVDGVAPVERPAGEVETGTPQRQGKGQKVAAPKTKKPTEKQIAAEMRAGTPLAVHETLFNDTISQGWVPTRNVLLKQLAEAGFGGQVYGKAFAETTETKIRELYPVTDVSKQKGVIFPTLDSLGFGDIKGPDNKTVKIPVFADDNTSGPFTNDPQTTAWQKNAGLSIKVPAGVAVNPAIKVNSRTGFVDYSTHNSGTRIYAKGDFKRAGNTIGSYLAFQNKQGFGASLETLPPFDSSKLAGPVDFAGMRIIPGETTEDDILRFYFAPSSDGGPSKIESAINASASGMSAVDKDQIRAAAQLSFIRELREFTLDMNDVGSVDPKGFLRTPDGYKAGIENRIANVWSKADRGKDGVINTSGHWNERGRPSHLAFFVKDAIRNHEKANERRPDANVQLGSDDVDQATALERAAARNDADNAGDMLVALDEAFTPEVLRGSAAIMGMPPETGIVDVASGVQILVSRIDSVPALRKAFEQAYLATLDLPPGPSAKRAVAIQKAKAMASDELVVLASRSALVQPGVVQAVRDAGFFKSLSYGLNTFTDAEIAQHRADNRAAVADLQLDGDLRSAIERIARSAKYPRRYRAIMLAALKMQVLPNISIVDAPAEAYAGSYTHSARLITLNLASSNGRGMLDVLAHELLHAATLEAIANPQTKAAKELLARLERARQKAAEVVPSDMSYAVSSIDEFITHAATDPRLQVILRETFEKGKTTWQRVVDAIAKFFGIANPDFVSDLWGFINHAAEYGLRPGVAASREAASPVVPRPDIRYSMAAPAPATAPASTLLEDTKARTVAGTTVGTRNPTSKTAAESGTDPKALVDRASMRRDPELYRKNAVMLADFPLVAGQVPEAAQLVRRIKAPVIEAQAAFDAASAKLEKVRAELKAELARRAGVRATAIKIAEVDKLEAGETKIARGDTAIRGMLRNIEQARKAQEKARDKRTAAGEAFKAASKTLMAGNRFPIELADRVYDAIETAATRNLELLIELFPAALRDTARLWYDGANIIAQEFAAQFGTTLNRSSAVLAVFSPQKDWFMNVALAKRMMKVWANHQNTPFDGEMAAQYLKRAGEPEPIWDKKANDHKRDTEGNIAYTKGAKPVLDDEGNITGWTNWSAESAREKFKKAEEDLAAMRGKTLAELPIEFQARFIRMWSEVYDSSNFPIVSPDGSFGDNKLSEKGNPQRIAWGSYVTIEKAIAIMTAPEADEMQVISDELGVQHKVRSFYNNIVDPANTDGHVTMDTHAIAAILWQALSGNSPEVTMNFGGGGASGSSNLGVSGLYPAFAEAYRKVAEKFGLLPREIQSITWESVRLLFPAKFKSQKANVEKVREIWRMHELNLLTTQQAHDRIFQIVDEWKRRSTLAGQPGRTAAEAVADGTGVGDPDWAEIARRGQNNSGAPPVAPDAGGLPAGGRRGDGAGRPAVGRRGAGRDAGLLPGSAAGDQPGSVLGALTPEGAALDGSRGSVDQFLPTLPAGVTYSFDDTRPKYLAFARRSQPGVVTINKQALAAVIAGLSPANARAIVSKIVKHEIAHLAAFSTFTDADIAEMARGMSAHEINEVARRYYDSPDALARLDADLESGAITNEALVEEYLRMQLELATDGATTEATIAFHSNNPGFVARLVRYFKDALVALWRNVAGPQEDYVNRIAISRLAREYRAILRGHAPLRAEPFDPADPNRDTRAALAPQTNTDPDADAAIREIFTESVEDFTTPYKPGDMWRKLFVTRTGDRRFPAISDKRQSSLVANERLVFSRRKQLNAAIKAEKPDAQVLAAAAGDTSPTTTPEQDAYIAEEFAAAMAEAREIEDPAEQATAIAEAYALKQRLTTAAYVETARIKKRRIDEAFAELERTAPKTAANLKAMREGIDNISRIVKEYQPDASPLRMVLGTQEGIYLTRVYRIHHKDGDPLSIMSDPTMADVRERAQDQLMESIIKYRTAEIIEQEAEAGKTIGETEARDIALAEAAEQDLGRILLEDYLLSHGSKALPHNGSDFRTDLTRFFKKMPVPEALRHVLEEVTDPVELLTRTGLNVGMLAASTVFTRDLARAGFTSGAMVTGQQWASYRKLIQEPDNDKYLAMLVDNGWAKRKPAAGYVEVAPDVHVPAWLVKAKEDRDLTYVENFRKVSTTTKKADAGQLADLYAHPDVAAWMDHQFTKQKAVSTDDAKLVQKIGEVFAKATGTSLGIATLGSVGFYSRNLVGTVFFLAANGINPFSAKSARASKLAVEAFLNRESGEVTKLTGIGVLNDDLRPETIKELLKGETDRPGGLNILELIGKVLGGKKGVEYGAKTTAGLAKLAELATAIDGIAKATAYYAELETMREAYPDKSAKWHEDEAAKVVKLTHQAKSQTPPFIDALTSSSYGRLMSPYLRFKGEMFRLTGNIIAQSAAEIRSNNPAIRSRGYKRAAGFAMISAFSVAGPALISAMYGVGDDEEFALRKALPSYLRGNSIIYIPSDDGKSVTSLDFTYLNPYSFIGDPISRMGRAVLRGEPGEGVDELAIWMNSSFLSEQILAGAAMEVLRNKTSDDKPITFETDSADEKLIKFSKHLVESSFTPQSLKAIQRSYDTARRGTPDDTPFFETAPGIIIGHGMPIRPRAFETEALALRAARTQAETNRQVRALAGQLKRRINFTEGDIQDIVDDLQGSTASLNQDIARMISGYEGLGLPKAAIAKQLVEAGRSREFARAIVFRGVAAGPSITPATKRDLFEAGEAAGGPGGGEKRTRAVAEALRQYEKVQQVRVVPQD